RSTGGYQPVDNNTPYILRFEVPQNAAVLQKTLLSLSLMTFRVGTQSTSGASSSTSSGASSATSSDDENAHVHSITIHGGVGLTSNIQYDPGGPSGFGLEVG